MLCAKCGHENPQDAGYCGECGSSLTAELTCANCGRGNPLGTKFCHGCGQQLASPSPALSRLEGDGEVVIPQREREQAHPTSFVSGRYFVRRFLGEGGKKRVYLAHDTILDRDVAFALIKTEGLDEAARARITREAQAMGRLVDHPHIVTIFDIGTEPLPLPLGEGRGERGQPYLVLPLMPGGNVGDLIEKAENHQLSLELAIRITDQLCQALEHAHSEGIIHRDVKPGNVWLTADGTAKLGDFGLAVAIDRSRLTQAGMMVGTVSYMPPEQAMGGTVEARSDLYSVGCMLYEMVTGRPPFVGDDNVAIIGQHLNTPPVSPSWHRPDLPKGLEALILRLLQKDPNSRPASASEVRQALASIDTSRAMTTETTAVLVENPLYRRTFVGREAELRQLQSAFDGAMSGQGALAMVVGEPGIGKTALVEQLATYVALRGGRDAHRALLRGRVVIVALPRLRGSHALLRACPRAGGAEERSGDGRGGRRAYRLGDTRPRAGRVAPARRPRGRPLAAAAGG